jgi:hypothetical protein
MSILSKDTIKAIGESVGLNAVSDEVAQALAADTEYRIREIIQVSSLYIVKMIDKNFLFLIRILKHHLFFLFLHDFTFSQNSNISF